MTLFRQLSILHRKNVFSASETHGNMLNQTLKSWKTGFPRFSEVHSMCNQRRIESWPKLVHISKQYFAVPKMQPTSLLESQDFREVACCVLAGDMNAAQDVLLEMLPAEYDIVDAELKSCVLAGDEDAATDRLEEVYPEICKTLK